MSDNTIQLADIIELGFVKRPTGMNYFKSMDLAQHTGFIFYTNGNRLVFSSGDGFDAFKSRDLSIDDMKALWKIFMQADFK